MCTSFSPVVSSGRVQRPNLGFHLLCRKKLGCRTATGRERRREQWLDARRSLRGVVLTNLAENCQDAPPAKAREARLVDEGRVVAFLWRN